MAHAPTVGMICFSSPFDETAIDFLEDHDVPAYKIASFENNHLPLIEKAACTGKPLIISTGMASVAELDQCVKTALNAGCKQLVLLKCTSTYPAEPINTNIRTIPHLRDLFGCEVGLSDHTLGIGVSVASVGLGATVLEKHLTLSRSEGGVDSAFSLEPDELKHLKRRLIELGNLLALYITVLLKLRKIVFNIVAPYTFLSDIQEGELFSHKNLRIIRPGDGAPLSLGHI